MSQLLLLLQLLLAHLMMILLLLVLYDLLGHLGQAGGRARGHAPVSVGATSSHMATLSSVMVMISGCGSLNFDNVRVSSATCTALAYREDLLWAIGISSCGRQGASSS